MLSLLSVELYIIIVAFTCFVNTLSLQAEYSLRYYIIGKLSYYLYRMYAYSEYLRLMLVPLPCITDNIVILTCVAV